MTFGEKLKKLRSDKGLTQDELAEVLFVSRTAISKWESERGFPNIESLKAISKYFSLSIDELLSGDELITLAEQEQNRKEMHIKNLIFGLLDCSMALLLFLPFFAHSANGSIEEVSLLALAEVQPYLRIMYFTLVIGSIIFGILTLVLKNDLWARGKIILSLTLSTVGVILFIVSRQPYAAVFVFVFLAIKALMHIKRI